MYSLHYYSLLVILILGSATCALLNIHVIPCSSSSNSMKRRVSCSFFRDVDDSMNNNNNNTSNNNKSPNLLPLDTTYSGILPFHPSSLHNNKSKRVVVISSSSLLPPRRETQEIFDGEEIDKALLQPFILNITKTTSSANNQGITATSTTSSSSPIPLFSSNKPNIMNTNKNTSLLSTTIQDNPSSSSSSPLYSISSSSILDGVLPVSELFYRSTQSLVDNDHDDDVSASTTRPTTSDIDNNSPYGDDEELPFSAEVSNRLTSKGVNKINIRRNEAPPPDTSSTTTSFTTTGTPTTTSLLSSLEDTNYDNKSKQSLLVSSSLPTNNTSASINANNNNNNNNNNNANNNKAFTKKTTTMASYVRAPRYLTNTNNVNPKYNSNATTTTNTQASTSSLTQRRTTASNGNTKRTTSSNVNTNGKILRRGMEMLVGGEPINADPPLKSIEIRYDSTSNDFLRTITTSSRDFGPLLHLHSASLVSSKEKEIYCEFLVNSAMKWNVCPSDFSDLVREYHTHTTPSSSTSSKVTAKMMLYQDLIGKLKYDDDEDENDKETSSSSTRNDELVLDDKNLHQEQHIIENINSEQQQLPSLSSTYTSTSDLNINNTYDSSSTSANNETSDKTIKSSSSSSRGFGKQSPLLRGRNRKSSSSTKRTELLSLEIKLDNILRHELMDEDGEFKVFRRILSKAISKAVRAEEFAYIVRIQSLNVSTFTSSQEDGTNATTTTHVSVSFIRLPDPERHNKKRESNNKVDDLFSQKSVGDGDAQTELANGIATAMWEEEESSSWSLDFKHRFIRSLFPGNTYIDEAASSEADFILERSGYSSDGELKFELGVKRDDLERGVIGGAVVLRRVLSNGIERAIRLSISDDNIGSLLNVVITRLALREVDTSVTEISVHFSLVSSETKKSFLTTSARVNQINHALSAAVDSGDMCRSMAAAARSETAWPVGLRIAIANELLFEAGDKESILDEEEDETTSSVVDTLPEQQQPVNSSRIAIDAPIEENIPPSFISTGTTTPSLLDVSGLPQKIDGPFVPSNFDFDPEDLYLGGGNGGVFFDHSEQNVANAPFQGNLGPLLMDAATERARQRQPRVIAIGDVHGCLDELQALLRRCCYQPGDLVVFLGDLVSKGPDSLSVVQMAREIGSFGVRGNHDFEVIRWHQAIMSGADPPMIGSEHFHIASCLSKADLKWLYSLPWYLSSKDLGCLFVHAGFVPGIRLPKQNPRLMMNMRSILPDGTVTSKFFSNWAWSRLWDGPQTVLFGHDADRGLQQYEHAIGLDTGCVYGGRLTACILPEKRLVSVSAKREYFQYRRKQFD